MDHLRIIVVVVVLAFGALALWGCRQAGKQPKNVNRELTEKEKSAILAEVEKLARPSYVLTSQKVKSEQERTFFGGRPLAPKSLTWPEWKGVPQSFLGQIALGDLPPQKDSPLPDKGILYFFYDSEQSTWGFDPKDRGSSKVIYLPDADSAELVQHEFPKALPAHGRFKKAGLEIAPKRCLPDYEGLDVIAPDLPKKVAEGYADLYLNDEVSDGPAVMHQLLGYPGIIQNDMREECALVSNGLYCGDATGYKDPRAAEFRKQAADWVLLIQIVSDDDLGMMWGDCGTVYFWIRKDDLAKADFSKCWMVSQCY